MPLEQLPPHRILVVNDYEPHAKELAGQLRKAGHTAEIAYDQQSALELERTFLPEMVIIELGLSGMDAFAVARSLRAQTNRNLMLVSIMYGDTKHDHAEWEACFDDHVNKLHGMPLLMRGQKKLAEESSEDWVLSERIHRASDRAFVLKMLEAAAGRFSPAELAPSIPDELLREVRRLAESPSDLANYLEHGARPKQSGKRSRKRPDEALRRRYLAEYQKAVLDGASQWFRFFNP